MLTMIDGGAIMIVSKERKRKKRIENIFINYCIYKICML